MRYFKINIQTRNFLIWQGNIGLRAGVKSSPGFQEMSGSVEMAVRSLQNGQDLLWIGTIEAQK